MTAELVLENFLEFLLASTNRLLCLLVEKCDLASSLKQLSLSLIGELLQQHDLTVQRLDKLLLLISR